ncbi:MAG: serine hydroxymethyltransferase [Firmicutes bacterium]|nr:serine hydroxymethyltransferase [Bacillota bacterium]
MVIGMDNIFNFIELEKQRQNEHIELIASENFVSTDVLKAQGSILTNKYAEGYSNNRYYGGCKYIDMIEDETIKNVSELFNVKYANVQPHSGSSANMAVYKALLEYGDTVMGMSLNDGGHLTHGLPINFSGKEYNIVSYGVNKDGYIDYDEVLRIAMECKPKMIIAGATAYSRIIDFTKFREIADKVGAYLMVDMAHIAGLVAAGLHPNPCEIADVVTSTTHKTLRGPRGGIILTNNEDIIKKINKTVFPGLQGGPLMHVVAAKGVCFKEALQDDFKKYAYNVIKNAKAMSDRFIEKGRTVITGGTDNHLLLLDVKTSYNLTGLQAQEILESVNITCNKNTIPNETEKPKVTSGLRLGSAAMTTRGLNEDDFRLIADLIDSVLTDYSDINKTKVKNSVLELTSKYPLPY